MADDGTRSSGSAPAGDGARGPVRGALERLRAATAASHPLRAGDVAQAIGPASRTILLMAPALIVVTPLSAIPGLPSLCGIAIVLFSLQCLAGRRRLWLPAWIARREVPAVRLRAALDRLDGAAGLIDRVTRRRLGALARPPGNALPLAICFLCGAAMPFLELVPMTSSILGAAVFLFAAGMLARDGLLVLAGLGAVAQTGWVFALLG